MAQNKVTFIATRFSKHRIVLDPKMKKEVGGHAVASSLNGLFKKYPQGYTVEFENGQFATADPEIIEALKEHEEFGSMFVVEGEQSKPTAAAVKTQQEKKEVSDELASKCPEPGCGFPAKNPASLKLHMKVHEKN